MKKELLTANDPEKALKVLSNEMERRTKYYWKTKSGEVVPVEEMSSTHILNSIKKLEEMLEESRIVNEHCFDALDFYD